MFHATAQGSNNPQLWVFHVKHDSTMPHHAVNVSRETSRPFASRELGVRQWGVSGGVLTSPSGRPHRVSGPPDEVGSYVSRETLRYRRIDIVSSREVAGRDAASTLVIYQRFT